MLRKTRLAAVAALTAAGLALAGCSSGEVVGGETTAPEQGADELTPITVGLLQIEPSAAIPLGIDEGIFAKHGLDVTIQLGAGAPALLPGVTSGSLQFAIAAPLAVLVADAQGLGLNIIASYSDVDVDEDLPMTGVVVGPDSGITSWADLEGKTVATNQINNIGDLTMKAAVEKDGGNPDAVNFTEIAFPDQLAQLEAGHIDASQVPEPFRTLAIEAGNVFLGNPYSYVLPGMPTMVTFTSADYAAANPDIVDAFRAAVAESTALAMSDEALYRAAVAEFTGMPAEVADRINIHNLTTELTPGVLEDMTAMALRFGMLPGEPDLDTLLLLE